MTDIKLIKKEDYEVLKPYKEKIHLATQTGSLRGLEHRELKSLESIFHKYGGSGRVRISSCNSCVFTIMNNLSKLIKKYEDRYMKTKSETKKNNDE